MGSGSVSLFSATEVLLLHPEVTLFEEDVVISLLGVVIEEVESDAVMSPVIPSEAVARLEVTFSVVMGFAGVCSAVVSSGFSVIGKVIFRLVVVPSVVECSVVVPSVGW